MNLGLSLGLTGRASGASTPTPPSTPPSVVDSIQGGGTSSPQSGDSTLVATGSNRQVFVSAMSGTSRTWTSTTATITGSAGTVTIPRVDFRYNGTNTFEATSQFLVAEAALSGAGNGPYTVEVTATASNGAATKLGFVAVSIQDAPNAPTSTIVAGSNLNSSSITPTAANSLVIAAQGSSTGSSGATMTGATLLQSNFTFGDGVYVGAVQHGTTELTVSTNIAARDVFAMFAFAPG